MTIKLYPKQEEISNKSIELLNETDSNFVSFIRNRLYLSGEMGVGKTVIGSNIASKMYNDNTILIVAPDSVGMVGKWVDHLLEFNIKLDQINTIEKRTDELIDKKINVIKCKLLASKIFKSIIENPTDDKPIIDFLLIDEFHAMSKTALERLNVIFNNDTFSKYIKKSYFMTGTIFNEQFNDTLNLLKTTHFKLTSPNLKYIENATSEMKLPMFINKIWQYVSLSISLDDINVERVDDGPSQTIMPIEPIEIPDEEKMYFEFIKRRYMNLFDNKNEKVTKLKIAEYLDLPSGSLIEDRLTKVRRVESQFTSKNLRQRESYILGDSLTELSFDKSLKYIKLKDILKNNNTDRIMIYATNKDVSELIERNLIKDFDKISLKNYYDATDFIDSLNKHFESSTDELQSIAIVNPSDVTTGVDISADAIIWYQVLPSVQAILQAQRRVHRLSSDTDSRVYFLVYKMTFQEDLIEDVSNSAKNNASAYGTKDESALAQITGILLKDVK